MPKVSEEYLAERQEQVLEAAVRCFARTGFHATGMAEVIRESGLSAGSVYRYYKSKDDLIAAIVGRMIDGLQAQIMAATQAEEINTPGKAVAACIRFASAYLDGDSTGLGRVLPQVWTEALRSPPIQQVVNQKYGAIIQHFERLARQMQAAGTLDPEVDATGTAHLMLAALQGYLLQRLLLESSLSEKAYLDATEKMFPVKCP